MLKLHGCDFDPNDQQVTRIAALHEAIAHNTPIAGYTGPKIEGWANEMMAVIQDYAGDKDAEFIVTGEIQD